MVTLTVVVPATDAPPTLTRCIAALAASADRADQVVVVDAPQELSASAARNAGVAQAIGDVVLFVDADVVVHPDAIGRVRRAFTADPSLTAVFGSYDDDPEHPGTVSRFRNLLHHHVHQQGAGEAETFWTGLGAVRRTELLAIGGFDQDRYAHPSIEDIELGARLAARGGRVRLDADLQGTHLKRWTLRSMLWTDFARRGVPWVAQQVLQRRVSAALNLGWRHRLSALACLVGLVALALLQPLLSLAALVVLVGLNLHFYALLARRLGLARTGVGVGLHVLHHLVAIAAVPAGVLAALAGTRVAMPTAGLAAPASERPAA